MYVILVCHLKHTNFFFVLNFCLYKKNILITGAGGSIGSELFRQLTLLKVGKIIALDNSEIISFWKNINRVIYSDQPYTFLFEPKYVLEGLNSKIKSLLPVIQFILFLNNFGFLYFFDNL